MGIFFIPFALGPIKKVTVPGNAIPLLKFTATVGTDARGAGLPWLLFFETDQLSRELNELVMNSLIGGAKRIIPAATTIFYDESDKGAGKVIEMTNLEAESMQVGSNASAPKYSWGFYAETAKVTYYK